ncbi:hypothetical protein [Egicoccus halophilus]|uniref:Uncharacterized protein n=1 Tax=Egicoccus halophilus TaxID=1670830 RepID=A0A8J3EXW2_9ACTN|nr:hypothetical protein [Egicoccus halophilus]GGI06614.1 hypothetical protein GCM10011354_19970 [Egicoccus halophilus]
MTVVGRAALPTAVELFTPGTDPAARQLRQAVDRTLTQLPPVDSFVLLAAGEEGLVHDASGATLHASGQPGLRVELHHDEELLAALATRGRTPRVRGDWLEGPLAVLALLAATMQPSACMLPVTVPRAAGWQALESIAAGIAGAARATERRIAVVAAGDLALADADGDGRRAADWDRDAVVALRDDEPERLATLGPVTANRLGADGWAPLAVLLTAGGRRGPLRPEHLTVGGQGRLVAVDTLPS